MDAAIAEYRRAIELDPKLILAHHHLAGASEAKNQWDEAIAEYTKVIAYEPKNAMAHYNLGFALHAQNRLDEAIAAYKIAIDLQPNFAEAHCNQAHALLALGHIASAVDFHKRGHALGSKRKDWQYPSAQWLANAERLARLEAKLAEVVAGKVTPADTRERLGLVEVCRLQRRHVAAARLYADAFSADPKLADDLKACHRYNAACAAALAAAAQGADADKLDDQERRRLRQRALAWLRADLDLWGERLKDSKPDGKVVRGALKHWQGDADLAPVRDAGAVPKLSAAEQQAWGQLWTDVAELLKKTDNAE